MPRSNDAPDHRNWLCDNSSSKDLKVEMHIEKTVTVSVSLYESEILLLKGIWQT